MISCTISFKHCIIHIIFSKQIYSSAQYTKSRAQLWHFYVFFYYFLIDYTNNCSNSSIRVIDHVLIHFERERKRGRERKNRFNSLNILMYEQIY